MATAQSAIVLNGQIGLLTSRQMLAGAGKFWTVTNPTPGTGVVWATLPTVSPTANGLFVIYNGNVPGGANLYLDRLSLKQTATAPTATLSMNFEAYNETGRVIGTTAVATRTPVQINQGAGTSQSTAAVVQAFSVGGITIPAAVGTRVLQDTASIATGLTFVKDSFVVDFGQDGSASSIPGLTAARLTTPVRMSTQMGPIIVAPQTTTWLNMWWDATATNVPAFEYSLSFIEL